jgi:hypothetical protein
MLTQKFESIREQVSSFDSHTRIRGWNQLSELRITPGLSRADSTLTPQQYATLAVFLAKERESDVRIAATAALVLQLLPADPAQAKAREIQSKEPAPAYLGEWFWTALQGPQPAFVFGLSDPYARRRDEDALIQLGRFLPTKTFPHVDFQAIWMSDPDLEAVLGAVPYDSVVLIGRPNLYGPVANERWKKPDARYTHPDTPRPDLEPGELCPEWHRVFENLWGQPATPFVTCDTKLDNHTTLRTDYAIVQRYSRNDGYRWVTVLVIAGSTSLGTLGAVMWATTQFLEPVHNGLPIPVSPEIGKHSCLEALLEIQAPVTRGRWKPRPAKLLKLNVDRAAWNMTGNTWHVEPPAITLAYNQNNKDELLGMLFDGEPSPLVVTAESFRILARLCESAISAPGTAVSFSDLDGDGSRRLKKQDALRIRKQLQTLKKRYLGEGLILEKAIAHLAPAVFVDKVQRKK